MSISLNQSVFLRFILVLLICQSCQKAQIPDEPEAKKVANSLRSQDLKPDRYNVGFLIMDGVYNTELTAPYDIFQHTIFRDGIKSMNTFLVADTREPITSFEGIKMLPDFDYTQDGMPHIDILVVPSAEHHLDSDLNNEQMISWVAEVSQEAAYVTSHCDGAFVLAKAGVLDNVASTTFPSDVQKYKEMFPHLDVRDNVLFVHDGKYITSAGGAKSFEAALYLAEHMYGDSIARSLAKGLVIDWDLSRVPHVVVQ